MSARASSRAEPFCTPHFRYPKNVAAGKTTTTAASPIHVLFFMAPTPTTPAKLYLRLSHWKGPPDIKIRDEECASSCVFPVGEFSSRPPCVDCVVKDKGQAR